MPKTVLRNPAPKPRRAATPRQWRTLCEKALQRATAVEDRRAVGLAKALAIHKEQATLQALGILSALDLDRLFSAPPTSTSTND